MVEQSEQNAEQVPELSFMGHLEELRSRLFKAVIGIAIACCITGYYNNEIMQYVLLQPAKTANIKLQNTEMFGAAILQFKVVFITAIILSIPWIIYQVWLFVAPGLYKHEKAWARRITFYSTLCFLAGVTFGYFLLIPAMVNYLSGASISGVADNFNIGSYFSFVSNLLLATGLIFELPMVSWVLGKFGIITASMMSKYRRHAIVLILIIAAIITPSPDPGTQIMVSIPMYFLYELSVLIVKMTSVIKKKEEVVA